MGMGPLSGLGGLGAKIGGGLGALKTGLLGTAAGSAAGPLLIYKVLKNLLQVFWVN